MPITKQKEWDECVEDNHGAYGGACVNVAREVMRLLDEREGDFDTHDIICEADKNVKAGGIIGHMAGRVANMVSHAHSRGEEFRRKWNGDNQIGNDDGNAVPEGTMVGLVDEQSCTCGYRQKYDELLRKHLKLQEDALGYQDTILELLQGNIDRLKAVKNDG